MKTDPQIHTSVLPQELLAAIEIRNGVKNIIVDATLGLAGHAKLVLAKMGKNDVFIGFDADPRNLELARKELENLQTQTQIILIHANFSELRAKLSEHGIEKITGIYYDLGMSSLHFDEASRGFSFRQEGPLDMRLNPEIKGTAHDILLKASEGEIEYILREYGEEHASKILAKKIVLARNTKKFDTTLDLVRFMEGEGFSHIKTKMRVFQALRIAVNKELEFLETSLTQAIELLDSGGNIFVISFHSLEDRITKHMFQKESKDCICQDILCSCHHTKTLKIISKKPIIPSIIEQKNNSRSRSAKARHAQKISS